MYTDIITCVYNLIIFHPVKVKLSILSNNINDGSTCISFISFNSRNLSFSWININLHSRLYTEESTHRKQNVLFLFSFVTLRLYDNPIVI